jgi:hypothetical protein
MESVQFLISGADSYMGRPFYARRIRSLSKETEKAAAMWCRRCRQDVPGISLSAGEGLGCAQCGARFAGGRSRGAGHTVGVAEAAGDGLDLAEPSPGDEATTIDFDEWVDQEWPHLGRPQTAVPAESPWSQLAAMGARLDAGVLPKTRSVAPVRSANIRGGILAWFVLLTGFTALASGAALVIWSNLTGIGSMTIIGLPLAAGGGVAMLLGLALQLERIGQGHRRAAVQLEKVDAQLQHLQQTATLLGTTQGTAAQAFYAHLAEGANPQMLLADVKSQLDLLALRLSQQ